MPSEILIIINPDFHNHMCYKFYNKPLKNVLRHFCMSDVRRRKILAAPQFPALQGLETDRRSKSTFSKTI